MMEMHVPSDEGAVSEVLSDEQRDAVIDGLRDRTPAEALARARWDRELDPDHPWYVAWDDVSPRLRQEQVEFAEADIELLDAAGFRVVPIPDDNTLDWRDIAAATLERLDRGHRDAREVHAVRENLRALLDGQPEDRPAQCPTCGSRRPDINPKRIVGRKAYRCPDSWHGVGSGDTR